MNAFKTDKKKRLLLFFFLAVLLYCLGLFYYAYFPEITKPHTINDDFPQHLLWTLSLSEDSYFVRGDPAVELSMLIQPWGYFLLVRGLCFFFDPIFISKFFPFFLLLATSWFTFLLLNRRFGWVLAFAGVILMSYMPLERMTGFLARGFAFPLLMAFLYYWDTQKWRGVSVIIVLSALFYPVIYIVECLIAGSFFTLAIIQKGFKPGLLSKKWRNISIAVLLAGVLLLLKSNQLNLSPVAGPMVSKQEILWRSEYQNGGRVNLKNYQMDAGLPFTFPIRWYIKLPYPKWTIRIIIISFFIIVITDRKHPRFNRLLIALLGSGIVAFYLARWLFPMLFQPGRYIFYAYLPFFYLIIVRILGIISRKCLLIFSPLIIIAITYSTFFSRVPNNWGLSDYSKLDSLYRTIKQWDYPAKIAAPMAVADQIPTFCRQSVFISYEMAHALYFKNYYAKIKKPLYDVVKGYCATEADSLKSIIQRYELDYIVIDQKVLKSNYFFTFEPYQSYANQLTRGRQVEDYALSNVPEEFIIPVDDRFSILDCKAWVGF